MSYFSKELIPNNMLLWFMLLTVEFIGCNQSGWRRTWYSDMLPCHTIWFARNCCKFYTVKRSCAYASIRICDFGGQVPLPCIVHIEEIIYANLSIWLFLGFSWYCSGNKKDLDLIEGFKKGEEKMNEEIAFRTSNDTFIIPKERIYKVVASGASLSSSYSISLLHQYCSKLPHDEYGFILNWTYSLFLNIYSPTYCTRKFNLHLVLIGIW